MTAAECLQALKYGVWHLYALPLPLKTRLQLMALKIVAIVGYHYGKYLMLRREGHQSAAGFSKTALEPLSDTLLTVPRSASEGHKVAVVVPVYAKTHAYMQMVTEAVEALCSQTRLPDLVLVVDDFSPVPLPESIERKLSNGHGHGGSTVVKVLKLRQNSGPAVARNAGLLTAKQAGATLVLFLDSDCTPDASWVEAMEEEQRMNPGIICGRTLSTEPGTAVGLYHDVCGTLNGRLLQDGSMLYGCTCNLSVDTSRVGIYFDTSFPRAAFEDVEFCVRARKAGVVVTYTSKAVMRHRYEPGCLGLFRQFLRYGSFERQMCAKHPEYLNRLWSSLEIPSISAGALLQDKKRN